MGSFFRFKLFANQFLFPEIFSLTELFSKDQQPLYFKNGRPFLRKTALPKTGSYFFAFNSFKAAAFIFITIRFQFPAGISDRTKLLLFLKRRFFALFQGFQTKIRA